MALFFEDDELIQIINNINSLQMIFHDKFAPEGWFDFSQISDLRNKKRNIIFIGNNILSPICDSILYGKLTSDFTLRKVATLIVFANTINAALCIGLALIETDTANKNLIMANKRNQLFLYATETIPAMIWKDIALGYTNEIPKVLLATFKYNCSSESFRLNNNLFYLMLQAGLTKIVNLYRGKTLSDFDKFVSFLEWYIDNMLISESMIIYAALLFGNVEGVRSPKNVNSKNYEDVVAGIDNQSWDLFYVSEWSSYYYNEDDDGVNFFATDDKTLKYIIVNIFPKNECLTNLSYIFQTKKTT